MPLTVAVVAIQPLYFARAAAVYPEPANHGGGIWCMRALVLAAFLIPLLLAPTAQATASAPATDGPGAPSHFDLARKDCIGTARNTTSKVWFTLANGVVS